MDPITVSTNISLPPDQVFDYLADISNHAEFTDHYRVDWHMTREETVGTGAGARFRIKATLNRFSWADVTLYEMNRPIRIVERGRGGKFNRIRRIEVFELTPVSGGTKVEYTMETETKLPSDKLLEGIGRGRAKRQAAKSMRRLRSILEEDRGRGQRASIASR